MKHNHLKGLIAATHTPFRKDGALNLAVVEQQAQHLSQNRIDTVFIAGSTGESHSLALEERRQLTERWMSVVRGAAMRVMVHVGSNCLMDARSLAAHAHDFGASAISALAPSYFKPRNLSGLIEWCAEIAAAAPETPFYFYDIPLLTGTQFSMPDFLAQASERVPTLAGIKFTNQDLMSYQLCLHTNDGAFDLPWGVDESFLAALALGAQSAVGTTYNFCAPVFHCMMQAFENGDLDTAREHQFRAMQLIKLLAGYSFLGASKLVMRMLGVDVGLARLPNSNPTADQEIKLRGELEKTGFLDSIAQGHCLK